MPCCPQNSVSALLPSSGTALYEPDRTYVTQTSNLIVHLLPYDSTVTTFYRSGTGGFDGGLSPTIRDRTGDLWYMRFGAFGSSDDELTGVIAVTLHQIRFGNAFDEESKAIVMLERFGFLYDDGFSSGKWVDNVLPRALEYSPFENCLYALMFLQSAGDRHGAPAARADDLNQSVELWKVQFDGTYTVVWSASFGGVNGFSDAVIGLNLAVASDGAIWIQLQTPNASGPPYSTSHLYRAPFGGTPVELSVPLATMSTRPAPTPFAAVLLAYELPPPSTRYGMLIAYADGTSEIYNCPSFGGSFNPYTYNLHSNDFNTTYLFQAQFSGLPTVRIIDWKRCRAGWSVGGMTIAGTR